jgi:spermidine synthase
MKIANKTSPGVLNAVGLGILALGAQIVLIRLLLEIFHGNELTIGWALAVWLFGSSTGSFFLAKLIRKTKMWSWVSLLVFPIVLSSYFFIKFIPRIFHLIHGVMPSFSQIAPIFICAILPTALLCGVLFPYITEQIYPRKKSALSANINRVYIWESVGSLVASLVLNFLLFHFFNSLQIILIFIFLFILPNILWGRERDSTALLRRVAITVCGGIVILFFTSSIILQNIHLLLHAPYSLLYEKETPYGNIKLMQLEEQQVLMNQGIVEYTLPDPFSAEASTLVPLLSHPAPRKVLLLGGNLSDYLPYLTKIKSLNSVIYIEKDPFLLQFQRKQLDGRSTFNGLNLSFIQDDIRKFLGKTGEKFDVICLNQPEPSTLQLNRFYTVEFSQMVRSCLSPQGLYYFSIKSSENYLNPSLGRYISLLQNTFQSTFQQVFIIPGNENYFLVSEDLEFMDLLQDWENQLQKYHIIPDYFSAIYFKYRLSAERLASFSKQVKRWGSNEINTDFNLRGYVYHFSLWSKITAEKFVAVFEILQKYQYPVMAVFLLIFILLKIVFRKIDRYRLWFGLFMIGGISIALEMLILLEYQILFGTLYSGIAVIFGFFMLGLAAGAYWQENKKLKNITNKNFRAPIIGLLVVCMLMFVPMLVAPTINISSLLFWGMRWIFIPALIFLTGALTGIYFSLTTRLYFIRYPDSFSGVTYGIDLAGGILSALFISTFFIPLMGITGMLFFLLLIFMILLI